MLTLLSCVYILYPYLSSFHFELAFLPSHSHPYIDKGLDLEEPLRRFVSRVCTVNILRLLYVKLYVRLSGFLTIVSLKKGRITQLLGLTIRGSRFSFTLVKLFA